MYYTALLLLRCRICSSIDSIHPSGIDKIVQNGLESLVEQTTLTLDVHEGLFFVHVASELGALLQSSMQADEL